MDIKPFSVEVPEAVLSDLRERLARTRWPDEANGPGWKYGAELDYVKNLVEYWRDGFDWRAQEREINSYPHFVTTIDGRRIHFVHVRGKGPNPMPIIVTHGWPDSFFIQLKLLRRLSDPAAHGADPADSFDVVVPSVPGYGFSDRAVEGLSPSQIAGLWMKLMTDGLGYRRFAAQGGDWGAPITGRLGFEYPEQLIGIHMTSPPGRPYLGPGSRELTAAEKALVEERAYWYWDDAGYFHLQGTRPQTAAYGLHDSPAALAAWIVEKFRGWSDCGGDVESRFTRDELLTNITIYWATETANSSFALYYDAEHFTWEFGADERVTVPTAIASFPGEVSHPPREWGERSYNLQRWNRMPSGGHFASAEVPDLLAEDMRAFFRPLR